MAQIFISYSRKDEPAVSGLSEAFDELGHSVWFDHELSGGQDWWDQILTNICACDIFVFVLSPNSLNSTACKREYVYAGELHKRILPILVAEGVSPNLLPGILSQIQFVDYRSPDHMAALKLAKALNSLPDALPLPDPLPDPPKIPVSYLSSLTQKIEADSLNFEEQSSILFDLKRALEANDTKQDAMTLLRKFRVRRDLLATIGDEIDQLVGKLGSNPKTTAKAATSKSSSKTSQPNQHSKNAYSASSYQSSGTVASGNTSQGKPPDYTLQAVLLFLFGMPFSFLPSCLAVPAVVFSLQTQSKYKQGDIEGAFKAAKHSKNFCIAALALLIIMLCLVILYVLMIAIASASM
ncbi:TIR domain-containing protein [filamentous cyanobacterium LEGE 11480]|uniref:TIR domain-containing protein n=1 Tax=Romeriopsis navalis LEGE 11480 TaxID=2777977 RepID=A0A928Z4J4_9CYAN|nr:TIR domain-containing protein [Romeriopsis navalis]MBE9031834.1 TIR domain-containing protein [Romeriopsis navalis LEGE 11480]